MNFSVFPIFTHFIGIFFPSNNTQRLVSFSLSYLKYLSWNQSLFDLVNFIRKLFPFILLKVLSVFFCFVFIYISSSLYFPWTIFRMGMWDNYLLTDFDFRLFLNFSKEFSDLLMSMSIVEIKICDFLTNQPLFYVRSVVFFVFFFKRVGRSCFSK